VRWKRKYVSKGNEITVIIYSIGIFKFMKRIQDHIIVSDFMENGARWNS
jgi:hypothetical protein